MTTTFTTNKSLSKIGTTDLIGAWGPPVNTNTGIIDASFGGVSIIPVVNSNVILSSAQYQNQFLQFTGALVSNITVTFPAIGSFYTIINDTTGSSAFYITATTASTVAGLRSIGLPTGSMTDIMTDGTNVRFRNLPPAGSYWDYGGSSTPAWVTGCTVPPWLYCNGATFSSATYPVLANVCGGTTLPDFRGRTFIQLNDGTGRTTTIGSGVNGDSLFAAGGQGGLALGQSNLPNTTWPVTDPGHVHGVSHNANSGTATVVHEFITAAPQVATGFGATIAMDAQLTGVRVFSGGSNTPFSLMPPTTVTGIRMVRAA